tara:strand:- start:539 stop:766 length:228 start_codon:yes stop_codon:yes gene_type:complete
MSKVATEISMALNVIVDAQYESMSDTAYIVLEHARGHLLEAWEGTDKVTDYIECTIQNKKDAWSEKYRKLGQSNN